MSVSRAAKKQKYLEVNLGDHWGKQKYLDVRSISRACSSSASSASSSSSQCCDISDVGRCHRRFLAGENIKKFIAHPACELPYKYTQRYYSLYIPMNVPFKLTTPKTVIMNVPFKLTNECSL